MDGYKSLHSNIQLNNLQTKMNTVKKKQCDWTDNIFHKSYAKIMVN